MAMGPRNKISLLHPTNRWYVNKKKKHSSMLFTFKKNETERLRTFATVAPFRLRELMKNFNIKLFKYSVMIKRATRMANLA